MTEPTRKPPEGWEKMGWAERMDHARRIAGLEGLKAQLEAEARESEMYYLDPTTFTYRKWEGKTLVREEDLPPVHESVNPVFVGPFR